MEARGVQLPRAGVRDGYGCWEPVCVFCKSSACSSLLRHLSSLLCLFNTGVSLYSLCWLQTRLSILFPHSPKIGLQVCAITSRLKFLSFFISAWPWTLFQISFKLSLYFSFLCDEITDPMIDWLRIAQWQTLGFLNHHRMRWGTVRDWLLVTVIEENLSQAKKKWG